ncbi:H-NS histone family protein [Thiohalocapsa marina]|uniref:H-NS histone family protein n=1 Tax=Thiohalocapsa marina TaxID=424902 RepID=A0A5M8FEG8_9GAMM|nr:H-NS histone family protein [Thiohalocapsa marina]KAA6183049.1 H-NS histone family protein [Thiohalocapsa marina]
MELEHLSVDELRQRKLEMEQQQAEMDRLLAQKLRETRRDFVRELRDLIEARGYSVEEIGEQLAGRRRGGGGAQPSGKYYVDPQDPDNVYKRGPLPGWLKDKMRADGYDPDNKAQRDDYKASHLTLVEG